VSPTCTTGSSAERSVPPPSPSRLRRRPPKAATPASGAVTAASTPSRSCALRAVRPADGGHPPAPVELVSLPIRLERGKLAPDAAGHPRSLQIKEETILREVIEFMGRRILGPDRLRLLRLDLARSIGDSWREHDAEIQRAGEQEHIRRALHRQTLRLEEHDDPNHPVVAAAKQRIEELTSRQAATEHALQDSSLRRDGHLRQGSTPTPPRRRPASRSSPKTKNPQRHRKRRGFVHSGGGIRTRDLRVMSPTSYLTAPPRGVDVRI
jgi:hypothetical protein